ncbi:MAG: hypothetical protein JXA96_05205 [Sedimentisphaerales bacterium]|nr:hypothetical protein [Sedimentisphaerales bacterium]
MFNNEMRFVENNSSASFGFESASTAEVNSLSELLKNGYFISIENVFIPINTNIPTDKVIKTAPLNVEKQIS